MDRENKAYKKVLRHRRKCKKWGKEFCLECFGEGLNGFVDNYEAERRKELGLPTIEEQCRQTRRFRRLIEEIRKVMNEWEEVGKCQEQEIMEED